MRNMHASSPVVLFSFCIYNVMLVLIIISIINKSIFSMIYTYPSDACAEILLNLVQSNRLHLKDHNDAG